jgi:hypothetical protein
MWLPNGVHNFGKTFKIRGYEATESNKKQGVDALMTRM